MVLSPAGFRSIVSGAPAARHGISQNFLRIVVFETRRADAAASRPAIGPTASPRPWTGSSPKTGDALDRPSRCVARTSLADAISRRRGGGFLQLQNLWG